MASTQAARLTLVAAAIACVALAGCDGGSTPPTAPDCSEFPDQATSPHILPWQVGERYQAFPHLFRHGGVQRFAIDFKMPIGTSVVASRAGRVVRLRETYVDGDHTPGHENHIFIEHDDGTVARYIHLTRNGALVEVGDRVRQGDVIGLSGDTGNSSEPHTHFDLTECCCISPPGYNDLPCGQTHPLTFRNTSPHPCGLANGEFYTAQPF